MEPHDSSRGQTTVAVVGSGAGGLGAAWLLARGGYSVDLFESEPRAGGHANTVDIPIPGSDTATIPVDTGFIVYNTHTYPDLVSLFQMLGVDEDNSSMSFSSSITLSSNPAKGEGEGGGGEGGGVGGLEGGPLFEWGSDSLATVFADRTNLYRPSMYTMLYDMRRFNIAVHDFVAAVDADASHPQRDQSLGQFLQRGAYSTIFIRAYLIPMVSAVWSASFNSALLFPARTLFRFFVNHGLAQVFARPQWRTPAKRSRDYVDRILADFRRLGGRVHLATPVRRVVRHDGQSVSLYTATDPHHPLHFHHVIFATHAPTTLAILGDDATDEERRILSAFTYSTNTAYVHHDANLMPLNRAVWSAWNFVNHSAQPQPNPPPASQQSSTDPPSSNSLAGENAAAPASDVALEQQHSTRLSSTSLNQQSSTTSVPPSPDTLSEVSTVYTEATEGPPSLPFPPTTDSTESPALTSTPPPRGHARQRSTGPNGEEICDPPSSTQSLGQDDQPVCVTYWLNRLQNFHKYHLEVPDLFLTLNPVIPIDPAKKLFEISYEHPQFTEAAVRAQTELQSVLQGRQNTWFCGAWARYGFHEDSLKTGLDVVERLTNGAVVRPWKMKNFLSINNNARQYEFPLSLLRAPGVVFVIALLVLNIVLYRLQAGLGKIAELMSDNDPVVEVAAGNGRIHRFGPRRLRRRTRSYFSLARPEEVADNQAKMASSGVARITVKNPRVLGRVTEALRLELELAPTAAAAFAAAEVDCPSPSDLTETLRALFIADGLDLDPSQARRGRAKLAESVLFYIVGDFKDVKSLPSNTRLPELTTCMSNVVYPSWWLQTDERCDDGVPDESDGTLSGATRITSIRSAVSPHQLNGCRYLLELLGDLSETTVSLLMENTSCKATIAVRTEERADFVDRKAELLLVRQQVTIVLLEEFISARKSGFGASIDLDHDDALYDLIVSPGLLNNYRGNGFSSAKDVMTFIRGVAAPDAVIELGVTVLGQNTRKKRVAVAEGTARETHPVFSGDEGFKLWKTREVLDLIEGCNLLLQRMTFMSSEEAEEDVNEVIQRVYTSLAEEKLEADETRAVMAQMCLWQAALDVKYLRRMAVGLKLR